MSSVSLLSLVLSVVTCTTEVWHDTAAVVMITPENGTALSISGAVFAIGSPIRRIEGVIDVGVDLCEPLEQPDLNEKIVLVKTNDNCSTRAKCNIGRHQENKLNQAITKKVKPHSTMHSL